MKEVLIVMAFVVLASTTMSVGYLLRGFWGSIVGALTVLFLILTYTTIKAPVGDDWFDKVYKGRNTQVIALGDSSSTPAYVINCADGGVVVINNIYGCCEKKAEPEVLTIVEKKIERDMLDMEIICLITLM